MRATNSGAEEGHMIVGSGRVYALNMALGSARPRLQVRRAQSNMNP